MSKPDDTPDAPETKARGTLTDDAELAVLVKVAKQLNALDAEGRGRVLAYLASKYAAAADINDPRR